MYIVDQVRAKHGWLIANQVPMPSIDARFKSYHIQVHIIGVVDRLKILRKLAIVRRVEAC
jgi:hypothetical protein